MPGPIQVVIDTNVFIGALKSNTGASAALFSMLPNSKWTNSISSALMLEYEEKAKDSGLAIPLSHVKIEEILDKLISVSKCVTIEKPRAPRLRDPDDEFVMDLAEAAKAQAITTFNTRNFLPARNQGIEILTPGQFLQRIRNYEPSGHSHF
jgi:putative PIN family toxin of toxin-antitoxin system